MEIGFDITNPLEYIPRLFVVLGKADSRGISDRVLMNLWPLQEHYIKNRTHRDIILKSRQAGSSTGILADNSHVLFTVPNERQIIITHDDETSVFLLQTVQRFHRNLPLELRPATDWKSGARIRFPKLDSYIYIDSAKSDAVGIGHGLTRAHLSEVAKWPSRKEWQLYADISQTVPLGGFITIESTPKGRGGLFYDLYTSAKKGEINYKVFFYAWWWDITCRLPVTEKLTYTTEEQQLVARYNLSPEQIAFRRLKISELGDYFFQEYPESDIDCWLSSEQSVFDGIAIRRYLQQVQPGRGEGILTVWKDVIGGEKYIIGADCAGGMPKGDYSVASVIRARGNEYVARLRCKMPPDLFAQEVLRLANHYNQALIAVEREMHGFTVLHILMENNYPNLYYHQDYDIMSSSVVSQPGFKTTLKSKPLMINFLAAVLRAGDIMLWSQNFLDEASGYTWDGEKKTRKAAGGYDDELDALMIAEYVREETPLAAEKKYPVMSYIRL